MSAWSDSVALFCKNPSSACKCRQLFGVVFVANSIVSLVRAMCSLIILVAVSKFSACLVIMSIFLGVVLANSTPLLPSSSLVQFSIVSLPPVGMMSVHILYIPLKNSIIVITVNTADSVAIHGITFVSIVFVVSPPTPWNVVVNWLRNEFPPAIATAMSILANPIIFHSSRLSDSALYAAYAPAGIASPSASCTIPFFMKKSTCSYVVIGMSSVTPIPPRSDTMSAGLFLCFLSPNTFPCCMIDQYSIVNTVIPIAIAKNHTRFLSTSPNCVSAPPKLAITCRIFMIPCVRLSYTVVSIAMTAGSNNSGSVGIIHLFFIILSCFVCSYF